MLTPEVGKLSDPKQSGWVCSKTNTSAFIVSFSSISLSVVCNCARCKYPNAVERFGYEAALSLSVFPCMLRQVHVWRWPHLWPPCFLFGFVWKYTHTYSMREELFRRAQKCRSWLQLRGCFTIGCVTAVAHSLGDIASMFLTSRVPPRFQMKPKWMFQIGKKERNVWKCHFQNMIRIPEQNFGRQRCIGLCPIIVDKSLK